MSANENTRELAWERAGLLDRMEHSCEKPGKWLVEGREVIRTGYNSWEIWHGGKLQSTVKNFTAAVVAIAEEMER